MKTLDHKKYYGDEYPAAAIINGIRMPLRLETRFSRSYMSDEHKRGCVVSRFSDGTASITASELQREWPSWTEDTRVDFCQSCSWLDEQPDFPEMLRFMIQHGEPKDWSGLALCVAAVLPRDEAFESLARALRGTELGQTAGFAQAIARTRHQDAEATLRRHLAVLWEHPALWDDAEHINWLGFDATTCIAHLIETGAPPTDFSEQVRQLSEHACPGNRKSCQGFLSKHYSWLKPGNAGNLG